MTGFQDVPPQQDPTQAARAKLSRALDRVDEQRRQRELATFRAAESIDPEFAGRAAAVARQIGLDPLLLDDADKLRVGEELLKRRELQQFAAQHPELERQFSDLRQVRMMRDDLGNLNTVSGAFDWWRRNFRAGREQNEAGILAARSAFAPLSGEQQSRLTELLGLARLQANESGILPMSANLIGQMADPAVAALGASAATGAAVGIFGGPGIAAAGVAGTAAWFSHTAATEFGHEFLSIRDAIRQEFAETGQGSPEEADDIARVSAGVYALGAASLDTFAAQLLGRPFKSAVAAMRPAGGIPQLTIARARGRAVSAAARGYLGEIVTEGAQELLASATEAVAARVAGTPGASPTIGETAGRTLWVMGMVAQGMLPIAPVGPSLQYVFEARRAARTQAEAEPIRAMAEAAAASAYRERDPEAFADAVNSFAQGGAAPTHMFVDAAALEAALARSDELRAQFARVLPDIAQALQGTPAGGRVSIPIGEFAAHVAGTELFAAVRDHITTDVNGSTPAQAEAFLRQRDALRAAAAQASARGQARAATWDTEAAAIESSIREQAVTVGYSREAAAIGELHRLFVEVMAGRSGKTPAEFEQFARLAIRSMPETTQAADQTLGEADRLTAFMEGSAVREGFAPGQPVDLTTPPMRVWHGGTFDPAVDPVFRGSSDGIHFGTEEAANARAPGAELERLVRELVVDQDEAGRYHWAAGVHDSFDLDEEGFATEEAARQNALNDLKSVVYSSDPAEGSYGEGDVIRSYYLRIKNPKLVLDQGGDWTKAIRQAKAEGHDGLVYRNTVEDPGSYSWVVFDPRQIKDATDNSGAFDPQNPSVLGQPRDLYVAHALTSDSVRFAEKIGGLAAPSLAVLRLGAGVPIIGFGNIVLIARPETASPEGGRARVFAHDAYTPRFPRVPDVRRASPSLNSPAWQAFHERRRALIDEMKALGIYEKEPIPEGVMRDKILFVITYALKSPVMSYLALRDGLGLSPEGAVEFLQVRAAPGESVKDVLKRFYPMTQAEGGGRSVAEFFHRLAAPLFPPTDREVLVAGKWVPLTAEAAAEHMIRQQRGRIRGAETADFSTGRFFAEVAPEFDSLAAVQENRERIVPPTADDGRDALGRAVEAIVQGTEGYKSSLSILPVVARLLLRKREPSPELILRAFKRAEIVPKEGQGDAVVQAARDAMKAAREAPSRFFEAKSLRAVPLSEFVAAAVGSGTPTDVVEILKEHIPIVQKASDGLTRADIEATVYAANEHLGGGLLFQPLNFTSAVHRMLDSLPDTPLSVEAWRGVVRGWVQKGLVKEREVFWSGLEDFLNWFDRWHETAHQFSHKLEATLLAARETRKIDPATVSQAIDEFTANFTVSINAYTDRESLTEEEGDSFVLRDRHGGEEHGRYSTEEAAEFARHDLAEQLLDSDHTFDDEEGFEPSTRPQTVREFFETLNGAFLIYLDGEVIGSIGPTFEEDGFGDVTDYAEDASSDPLEAPSNATEAARDAVDAALLERGPIVDTPLLFEDADTTELSDIALRAMLDRVLIVVSDGEGSEVTYSLADGLLEIKRQAQKAVDDHQKEVEEERSAYWATRREDEISSLEDSMEIVEEDSDKEHKLPFSDYTIGDLEFAEEYFEISVNNDFDRPAFLSSVDEMEGLPIGHVQPRVLPSGDIGHEFETGESNTGRLVHVRASSRTVGGNTAVLIEEVQSDLAQRGRDAGFTTSPSVPKPTGPAALDDGVRALIQLVWHPYGDKTISASTRQETAFRQLQYGEPVDVEGLGGFVLAALRSAPEKRFIWGSLGERAGVTLDHFEEGNAVLERKIGEQFLKDTQVLRDRELVLRRNIPFAAQPFVDSTEAWVGLGLKSALFELVTGGHLEAGDLFVLPRWSEIAGVYGSASSVVSEVSWHPNVTPAGVDGNVYMATKRVDIKTQNGAEYHAYIDDRGRILKTNILRGEAERLSAALGAAVATEIMVTPSGSLDQRATADIELGGNAWTRTFYGDADGNQTTPSGVKTNEKGKPVQAIVPKVLRDIVRKALPGATFEKVILPGLKGEHFAVRLSQESITAVQEGLPLFDSRNRRGAFSPGSNTIFVGDRRSESTILHEMGHYWLNTLFQLAADPRATPDIRADAQVMLDWFGVKDVDSWHAMTLDQQRPHHEAFALNVEGYFATGGAPSATKDQRRLMRTFRRWILRAYRAVRQSLDALYRSITGRDLPEFTEEVRGVLDRMLVAEDVLTVAAASEALEPLFRQRPEGATDADWRQYLAQAQEADDEALDRLSSMSLRALRWAKNARSRMLRRIQTEARDRRAEIEQEERRALARDPATLARLALRRGETLDDTGLQVPAPHAPKLNTQDVRRVLRSMDESRPLPQILAGMTSPDGVPVEMAASVFGFPTGEGLLAALIATPDYEELVDRRATERMTAEHSDLTDPETIARRIDEAIHNPARTRAVAAEIRFLESAESPMPAIGQAARAVAEETVGRRLVGAVKAYVFRADAARARREAAAAQKAGESAAALSAKRREFLADHQARVAADVEERVEAVQSTVRRLFRPDERLANTRDIDHVLAARVLAIAFGLAPPTAPGAAQAAAELRQYRPELFDDLVPLFARAEQWASEAREQGRDVRTWKDLTVEEFEDLANAIEGLWSRARRSRQVELDGRRRETRSVVHELQAQDAATGPAPAAGGPVTPSTERARSWRILTSLGRRVEHWATARDGGETGAWTRLVWRPVRAAVDRFVTARNAYTQRAAEIVRGLAQNFAPGKIEFRSATGQLLHTFGERTGGDGMAELVGAMLHTGNAGNLERLLRGRGWASVDPETGVMDTSDWDVFLARMVEQGRITAEVMNGVQAVWDLVEALRPGAQAAHRTLFGYRFREVEATPITFPFGTYRGGYFPAALDSVEAASAGRVQDLSAIEKDHRGRHAVTGRGFTRSRVAGFAEPLSLSLNLVPAHIDDVLRFTHLQPVLRDVESVFQHREMRDHLHRVDPNLFDKFILPWLARTASQSTAKAGMSPRMDAFWRAVRNNVGVSLMFGNIPNTLQQFTGGIVAAMRVKPRYLFRALWSFLSMRRDLYAWIAQESSFMADRQRSQVFESVQAIREIVLQPGPVARASEWVKRHAYFLQTAAQNMVDAVVWKGAYMQALDAGAANPAAEADAAVRTTQSSFSPVDVANFQEGTPFYQLFTQFAGYFNTIANLQADAYVAFARASGAEKAGIAIYAYLVGFAVPMLIADAITRTLRNQWDDEDEDGDVDVFTLDFLFLGQLRSAAALAPVIGPNAIAPLIGWFDNEPWNDRMTTSPSVSVLERAGAGTAAAIRRLLDGEEVTGRNVRDVVTALGVAFGFPGGAVGSRAAALIDAEDPTPAESLGAVLIGTPQRRE